MTPLDDDIRALLDERARRVGAPDDVYAVATARARSLRRRRRAALAGGLAAVVAAVAVPLALTDADGGPARVQVVAPPSSSPAPSASASAAASSEAERARTSASAAASAAASRAATAAAQDAASWPFRGDQATRTALAPGAYAAARAAGVTPELTLWAGTTPNGGWSGLIFRGHDGTGRLRLLTWLSSGGGTTALVRNDPLPTATVEIDQQLPSDPANALVVLGPPGTTTIAYAAGGGTPTPVTSANGVAMVGLSARGDGGTPRLRITQSGRVVYDGPPTGGALPALG